MTTFIRCHVPMIGTSCLLFSMILLVADTMLALPVGSDREPSGTSSIILTSPNGGQVLVPHSQYNIRWLARGVDSVSIDYSPDGGSTWLPVAEAVPATGQTGFRCSEEALKRFIPNADVNNMGSYTWSVPEIESNEVLIRVLDQRQSSISDVSKQPFAITRRVTDGWTQQSVGPSVGLECVSIVNDSIAWIGAQNGAVFRTTNGGLSWSQGPSLSAFVISVSGVDKNTAFACVNFTDDGRVYRTTNGGVSWTLALQYAGPSASMLNFHMFDASKGFALGNRSSGGLWKLFRTSNGGTTWDTLTTSQSGYGFRNAVAWASEMKGWFGTDGSYVCYTTNGGLTWTPADLGSLDAFCLVFPSEQLGMASTAFRYVFNTTDGGTSWTYVTVAPAPHPACIISFLAGVAKPTPRWWEASLDEIYKSTNHGISWTFEAIASGYPFNDISMKYVQEKGVIVGYAVGAGDGVVMKYRETVTSAPEEPTNQVPSSIELYQNYPNPFNPSTTLSFTIPHSSFVSLRLFNILGQEVRRIVDEKMEAGVHRVEFQPVGLPSGVYVYRIESGGHAPSQKMLLLK